MPVLEPRGSFEPLPAIAARGVGPPGPNTLRVLHLLSSLERGGTERLVLLLAREQVRLGCQVEVAVLTSEGPMAAEFKAAGFRVHSLGLRHKLAPAALAR